VYGKCGFEPLAETEKWMGKIGPRPERKVFEG
jgi:hypothetical protein